MKSRPNAAERSDILLAPTVRNAGDRRDIGVNFADCIIPEHGRVGGGQLGKCANRGAIRNVPCKRVGGISNASIEGSGDVAFERGCAESGVIAAGGVGIEGKGSASGIVAA